MDSALRPLTELTEAQLQRFAESIFRAEEDTPGMDFRFYAKQLGIPSEHLNTIIHYLNEVED